MVAGMLWAVRPRVREQHLSYHVREAMPAGNIS